MRHYDTAALTRKKNDLIQEIEAGLGSLIDQQDWIAAFNSYFKFEAPYTDNEFIPINNPGFRGARPLSKIVLADPEGLSGGYSRKPGNIIINLKKLIESTAETAMAAIDAAGKPWMLIMIGLLACRKIYQATLIDLDERHALVISALWRLKAPDSLVLDEAPLNKINDMVSHVNRNPFSLEELSGILSHLDNIKVICLEGNGVITLIEKVETAYSY